MVFFIKPSRITGKKTTHEPADRDRTGSKQQMRVIGDQCPRETLGLRFRDKFRQATNKITPVIIRSEYLFTLYPSDDNVMQCNRYIYP